jgi:hypothetical protein
MCAQALVLPYESRLAEICMSKSPHAQQVAFVLRELAAARA